MRLFSAPFLVLLLAASCLADGWDFLERGKLPYARTWFGNRLKKNPEDADLMVGLGLAHCGLGDLDQASEILLQALRRDGDHALGRRALARVFLERARRRIATGRRDEASRILLMDAADQAQRSLAVDPAPVQTWTTLANVWFELGETEQARAALREIESRGGAEDAKALAALRAEFETVEILRAIDDGSLSAAEAADRLRAMVEARPDSVELRLRLGDLLHRSQRWLEALEQYRAALALDPFLRPCLELLLAYLPFDGLREPAHEILQEADRAARKAASGGDPRPGFPRYCLGQAQLLLRDWDAAIEHFEEALELDESLIIPCGVGLGDARFRTGEHAAATEAYLSAVRADRLETVARIHHLGQAKLVDGNLRFLANQAVEAGQQETARDLFHAALGLVEDEPSTWNNYAFLCRETKQYEEAGAAYLRLCELSPDDPRVLNDTALVLHYHLERGDEARALYQRAIAAAERVLADGAAPEAAHQNARSALKDARDNLRRLGRQ